MKFPLQILAAILISATLFGCDKDYCIGEGITGAWIWKESIGGWGTLTPANTGDERVLHINSNTFKEFRNGELHQNFRYEIIAADERFYGSPQTLQLIDGPVYILTHSKDELILDSSFNDDSPTHYYTRP
jgi:hypothetical protein